MSDKVYIFSDHNSMLHLQWNSDGENSAILGDEVYTEHDFNQASAEDRWYIAATIAVAQLKPKRRGNFYFETMVEAEKALNVALAAKKRQGPMPEWAIKAQAAGWKAPKGWHP